MNSKFESPDLYQIYNDEGGESQLQEAGSSNTNTINLKTRRVKGANWTDIETEMFICLCKEKRILRLMDGKKYKHLDIYKSLEPEMKERGLVKSASQMKTKLKHLKEMYFKCKRNNGVSGHDCMTFTHYSAMDELLRGRPSAEAVGDAGIDSCLVDVDVRQLSSEEAVPIIQNGTTEEQVAVTPKSSKVNSKGSGGRKTNIKRIGDLCEAFGAKQNETFLEMLKAQNESLEQAMRQQMEEQRQWESEMMKREHDNQMKQMSMLMDGFFKGLQMMSTAQNLPPSMFYPNLPNQLPFLSPILTSSSFPSSTASTSNTYLSQSSSPINSPSPSTSTNNFTSQTLLSQINTLFAPPLSASDCQTTTSSDNPGTSKSHSSNDENNNK